MKTSDVPIIDISRLGDTGTRRQLDLACREWGVFWIVEHGIDAAVIEALTSEMHSFFAQPREEKQKIARTAFNPSGYFDAELTKNTRDWKEIYDYYQPEEGCRLHTRWPDNMPLFERAIKAFYTECLRISVRLMRGISNNLGMPSDFLDDRFQEHSSFLRLNHYPVCPNPESPSTECEPRQGYLGLNRHTDAGALTILLQDDQPGLEVYSSGNWHLVPPMDNAIIVNVGDIVQVWSNDQYPAALHRVVANSSAERYSMPFFFSPAYATDYHPLPSTVSEYNPPVYESINWGEFLARRVAGDYQDLGEEVQISQYRLIPEIRSGMN